MLGSAAPDRGFDIVSHDQHGQFADCFDVTRVRGPLAMHQVEGLLCDERANSPFEISSVVA